MINLMPPDQKTEIVYARRNNYMIRWLIGIGIAAVGIGIITGGGLFYLKQDSKSYQKSIDDTKKTLVDQKEEETIKRTEEMSGNLQLVVDVLSKEILFSKLLEQIGQVMPPGANLQNLSLTSELQGGINLTISSTTYESGVRAQVNLADPKNKIFEKADIGDVTCKSPSELAAEEDPDPYPCTANMRALFVSGNNTFLKLNQGKDGQ